MRTTDKIDNIIRRWLDTCDCTERSRQMYDRAMGYWFRWLLLNRRDKDAPTDKDVRDYKQSLLSSGKSKYTVNRYVNTVVRFYRWCAAVDIWNAIGAGVRNEKVPFYCKRALTEDESTKLLNSVDRTTVTGKRDFAAILLMLSNGLRPLEVVSLRVCDISEDNHGVHWMRLLRKGHQTRDCRAKLAAQTWEVLNDYICDRGVSSEDEYVFVSHMKGTSSYEASLTEQMLCMMIKRRMRENYLTDDRLCAYSLRHTFATRLLKMGKTVDEVSYLMGHSNQAVTLRYVSMEREELMRNRQSLEELSAKLTEGVKGFNYKKTIINE